jgi:hypothetical protein
MTAPSDEARLRAEAKFKKKEREAQELQKVWAERAAAEKADDVNRARLKSLRLAQEASREVPPPPKKAAKSAKKPAKSRVGK